MLPEIFVDLTWIVSLRNGFDSMQALEVNLMSWCDREIVEQGVIKWILLVLWVGEAQHCMSGLVNDKSKQPKWSPCCYHKAVDNLEKGKFSVYASGWNSVRGLYSVQYNHDFQLGRKQVSGLFRFLTSWERKSSSVSSHLPLFPQLYLIVEVKGS